MQFTLSAKLLMSKSPEYFMKLMLFQLSIVQSLQIFCLMLGPVQTQHLQLKLQHLDLNYVSCLLVFVLLVEYNPYSVIIYFSSSSDLLTQYIGLNDVSCLQMLVLQLAYDPSFVVFFIGISFASPTRYGFVMIKNLKRNLSCLRHYSISSQ